MPLTIYRRHTDPCKHKLLGLGLPVEAHRQYTDCDCVIWIEGRTDTETYPRQSTKLRDWKAAEAYCKSLDAASKDAVVHGPTLEDCIKRYLAAKQSEVGPVSRKSTTLALSRLQEYAHKHNRRFIRELDVDMLEDFKLFGLPTMRDTSKSSTVAKVRTFLKEAYRRGWTLEALHIKMKSHTAAFTQKLPYTEKELEAIFEAAGKLTRGHSGYAGKPATFRIMLELMSETGLRCGDTIRFNPLKCARSEHMWIYTFIPQKQKKIKQPKVCEVYLTDRLKHAIDKCDWYSPKLPFAYREVTTNPETDHTSEMAIEVWKTMKTVGKKCSVEDCRPHRLRDSFAVRSLMNGVALEDVSKLLCHSSISVTEMHYAAWVPSRKLRLERLLFESLVDSKSN